ncbi:MAG: DUF3108 domain-containing protein [Acidobacteriaceae bacterium]|nr:DUF3108 domain-containing protein [Acidobacteriaceae bacterium]
MKHFLFSKRLTSAFLLLSTISFVAAQQSSPEQVGVQQPQTELKFPYPAKLTYEVMWRMLTAGDATVVLKQSNPGGWNLNLDLASSGLVSRLYRVLDTYKVTTNNKFCGESAVLDAQEGKKHSISRLTFDTARRKVLLDERNYVSNTTEKKQLDIPPCTYEITGALVALRLLNLPPGRTVTLPVTDGKKVAYIRVDSQARENLSVAGKAYSTIRYEAFVFDNVLYKRKGRLFLWMTDDAERIPVQFRLQMGFPIGNIYVELGKEDKL